MYWGSRIVKGPRLSVYWSSRIVKCLTCQRKLIRVNLVTLHYSEAWPPTTDWHSPFVLCLCFIYALNPFNVSCLEFCSSWFVCHCSTEMGCLNHDDSLCICSAEMGCLNQDDSLCICSAEMGCLNHDDSLCICSAEMGCLNHDDSLCICSAEMGCLNHDDSLC